MLSICPNLAKCSQGLYPSWGIETKNCCRMFKFSTKSVKLGIFPRRHPVQKNTHARAELLFCWPKTIRRLQIFQNFAQPLFLISSGYYSGPKRNWRQCLCKIFGRQTSCSMGDVQIAICCCRSSRWGPSSRRLSSLTVRFSSFNSRLIIVCMPFTLFQECHKVTTGNSYLEMLSPLARRTRSATIS